MTGHIYLIGAGPGAADLLTVRAARLLAKADVVLYDALVGKDVLALAPQARLIPVGKRAGQVSTDQAFINRLIVSMGRQHEIVVRLKGGDPMLFGRAHEEIQACRDALLPVSVVPGISAAFGAAAELGVSLTQRAVSRAVTFVTPAFGRGQADSQRWIDAVIHADTAVVYMGRGDTHRLRDALLDAGMAADHPIAFVENVGRSNSIMRAGSLIDLAELAEQTGVGPALLLIGKVFADLQQVHEHVVLPRQTIIA